MNPLAALAYLRATVAGLAALAVRVIYNRACPCEMCRAHRAFRRESAAAYRREVLGHRTSGREDTR